jgi:hypothetical protein
MADKARDAFGRGPPVAPHGGGDPVRGGYGAGGLGSGEDRVDGARPNPWDAPGVTPEGRRTGSSTEGPRMAVDGESEPQPDPGEES